MADPKKDRVIDIFIAVGRVLQAANLICGAANIANATIVFSKGLGNGYIPAAIVGAINVFCVFHVEKLINDAKNEKNK